MVTIFINGLNAKAGGGKSILNNYLLLLNESTLKYRYIVLVPALNEYKKYSSEKINIIAMPELFNNNLYYPLFYNYYFNKILRKYNVDVVLNLADIPIKTKIKQIFLFDWSYAVYPDSIVWKMMDFKSWLSRKSKLFFFKKNLKYIDVMLAQTSTMKVRLQDIYGIDNIKIVPNAVSLDNLQSHASNHFNLPAGKKLLYLTHYYPHKNLEVLIPLAKKIKKAGLTYKLITTIDRNQHKGARLFLETVEKSYLEDTIINIGPVSMENVPSLYRQCDALLMPTLLESFSGTYVEAMFHKIPILTSELDFASGVCGDAAIYFNPLDHCDILEKMILLFNNEELLEAKIEAGINVLNSLPDWRKTFEMYNESIDLLLDQ